MRRWLYNLVTILLLGMVCLAGSARAETAAELNEAGVALYEQGKKLQALERFREAHRLEAQDPVIRKNLENCLVAVGSQVLEDGRPADALRYFEEGEAIAPQRATFSYGRGLAHHELGESRRAIGALEQTIGLESDHAGAHKLLGDIYYHRNENDRALEHFEKAAALLPDDRALAGLIEKIKRENAVEGDYGEEESPHFTIRYDGDKPEVEILIRDLLEDAYLDVGARLSIWPDQPVPVILYSQKAFRKATGLHSWVAGAFDGKIRLPVQDLQTVDRTTLRQLVFHEYAHAALHTVARSLPAWAHEGVAQCMEDRPLSASRSAARKALEAGRLPGLKALSGSFAKKKSASAVELDYQVAHAFVFWLAQRSGWTVLIGALKDLSRGTEPEQAFRNAYGFSLSELEGQWRETLAR